MTRAAVALAAVALAARPGVAGVYPSGPPVPFAVVAGVAAELPYEPQFKALLDDRLTAPTRAAARGNPPADVRGQTDWAAAAIAAGDPGAAANLLEPRTRDRVPDFVALATLAHAHALRGEWADATRTHAAARLDADPPAALPGATADQTRWLLKVEREAYPRWLKLREADAARPRDAQAGEGVDDLFPGVRFDPVDPTRTDRGGLPADAVAVVQQLSLWAPGDTKLLWLLGEVYAATGRVREADKVFDQCTWGRGYTNRDVLMAHRRAVRAAVAALPPEAADVVPDLPATPAGPTDAERWAEVRPAVVAVAAGGGLVAAGMVALQVRAWRKRVRA